MGAYLGKNELFLNRFGKRTLREIYFGNKMITGFTDADYSADEMIGEKIQSGDYPVIKGTGSVITVSTNNYNPGYGFNKYYCDHMKFWFFYSGYVDVYDCKGNAVIAIENSISFSFATGKWEVGRKISIYGSEVFNKTTKATSIDQSYLEYEFYYDKNTRKWVVLHEGGTYTSGETDWYPVYCRLRPQIWFLISTYDSQFFDGSINITYMNKAQGMPLART